MLFDFLSNFTSQKADEHLVHKYSSGSVGSRDEYLSRIVYLHRKLYLIKYL